MDSCECDSNSSSYSQRTRKLQQPSHMSFVKMKRLLEDWEGNLDEFLERKMGR